MCLFYTRFCIFMLVILSCEHLKELYYWKGVKRLFIVTCQLSCINVNFFKFKAVYNTEYSFSSIQ